MDDAVAILSRTPATFDALLRGRPDKWIVAHEGGEARSPFDVIGPGEIAANRTEPR